MTPIEKYFDKIYVINLARRTDRWVQIMTLFKTFGITKFERFEAYDKPLLDGKPNGNMGCTASHRALLEVIAYNQIPRALIFEDDCDFTRGDFHERFAEFIKEVPDDWDQLYLGAGYGENPIARVSPHVIRSGRLLTTSSYGITWQHARKIAPYISGVGPIDSLMSGWHREAKTYIFDPRLCFQRPSFSDLTERDCNNAMSMLDDAHAKTV